MNNSIAKLKNINIGSTDEVETGCALEEKIKLIRLISDHSNRYGDGIVQLIDYAQSNGVDAYGTKDIPLYIVQKFVEKKYNKPEVGPEQCI